VGPSDYYLLLNVIQAGSDEITERSPKAIKRHFRALGKLVEGSGVQVVFSSIPSVAENSTERGRNHRKVGVARDLCGSSSPTHMPKQGHLQ